MAKKSKGNRVQVILECTEQKESGVPGMSRYITTGDGRGYAKVIKMVKSPKTGAYMFKEQMVTTDQVKEVLKK